MSNSNETNNDVLNFDFNESNDLFSEKSPSENTIDTVSNNESIIQESITDDSLFNESIIEEPLFNNSSSEQTAQPIQDTSQDISVDSLFDDPVSSEPIINEPVLQEPTINESITGNSSQDISIDSLFDDSTMEQTVSPAMEQPISSINEQAAPISVEDSLFAEDVPLFSQEEPIMEHTPEPQPIQSLNSDMDIDMKPLFNDAPPATAESLTPPFEEPSLTSPIVEDFGNNNDLNMLLDEDIKNSLSEPPFITEEMPNLENIAPPTLDTPSVANESGLDQLNDLNTSLEEPVILKEENNSQSNDNNENKNDNKKNIKNKKATKVPSNKPRKKWPIVLASVLGGLIVIGLLLAYLIIINPVTSNTILSTVLKPKMYYAKTELNAIESLKEDVTANFEKNFTVAKNSANSSIANTSTITLGEAAYEYGAYLGNYSSILSSLQTITLKTDSYVDNDKYSYVIDMLINNQSITVINIMINKKNNTLFVQIPAINTRWFKYTLSAEQLASAETSISLANDLTLSASDVNQLIDTYLPVIIYFANNVTLEKDVTLEVNNSKIPVREAVIKYSVEEVGGIIGGMLTQAKTDKTTYKIIESLGLYSSQADFTKAIDTFIEKMKNQSKEDNKLFGITMSVFIDKNGNIIGRKFIPDNKKDIKEVSYISSTDEKGITKYSFKLDTKNTELNVTGNNKLNGSKNNGSIVVDITSTPSIEYSEGYDEDITIDSITPMPDNEGNTSDSQSSDVMPDEDSTNNDEDEYMFDEEGINLDDEEEIESISEEKKFGFTIEYTDYEIVNADKGIVSGTFDVKLSNMPSMLNPSIQFKMFETSGYQDTELNIDLNNKNLCKITSSNTKTAQTDVVLPTAALDIMSVMTDKVIQYNLLLELNVTPTVSNLVTSFNNKTFTLILAQYLKQSGLVYFNGRQTPITLYVLGKVDPSISAIFAEGYKATKSGLNPGLDAQMVSSEESN